MNTQFFIARRILSGTKDTGRYSKPIVRIAIGGIALGLAVMILSLAIVTGFQSEIRSKVIGFGSHIQITSNDLNNSNESSPISIKQSFYPDLTSVDGVRHIQIYATKPGIIETKEEIQGVIVKGIGPHFDWSFFKNDKYEGEILQLSDSATTNGIIISRSLANKLTAKLDDRLMVYLIVSGSEPRPRKFTIKGIYETGLEEFDNQYILADIGHIQKVNKWGLTASVEILDECIDGRFLIEAKGITTAYDLLYKWNNEEWSPQNQRVMCVTKDTSISIAVSDDVGYLKDSLRITFTPSSPSNNCQCPEDITYTLTGGNGSAEQFVGGFEVLLESYDDIIDMDEEIYASIPFDLTTKPIVQQFGEIFSWLEMQDINVVIIIILMILVAGINMVSALIVMILERTNMIGILKSIGETNSGIQKIFLFNAGFLITRGLILGNIIGIGLCIIQQHTGLITLPEETYYVSIVPVNINILHILLLNVGTLLACVTMLVIPSFIIAKISPVRAIRFN